MFFILFLWFFSDPYLTFETADFSNAYYFNILLISYAVNIVEELVYFFGTSDLKNDSCIFWGFEIFELVPPCTGIWPVGESLVAGFVKLWVRFTDED